MCENSTLYLPSFRPCALDHITKEVELTIDSFHVGTANLGRFFYPALVLLNRFWFHVEGKGCTVCHLLHLDKFLLSSCLFASTAVVAAVSFFLGGVFCFFPVAFLVPADAFFDTAFLFVVVALGWLVGVGPAEGLVFKHL